MAKDVKKCPSYHLIASAVDGNEKDMYKLLQFYDAISQKPVCVLSMMNTETYMLPSIWN